MVDYDVFFVFLAALLSYCNERPQTIA